MTYEKYLHEVDKINARKKQKLMRQKLREKRRGGTGQKRHNMETNKLIALYLFALLNAIVIYAMVAMWKLGDLSYLGALISDIAAQVVIYAIYCAKAYAGKKAEENMKFERDKWEAELNGAGPEDPEE